MKKLDHSHVIQLHEVIDDADRDKLYMGKYWYFHKNCIDINIIIVMDYA